jgi:hypothetical protein
MNDEHAKAVAAATAEVKRLKKRVSYWRGRTKGELNKRWRAMYVKATESESVEAFLTTDVTLNNHLVMSENYETVAQSEAGLLRRAEQRLKEMEAVDAPHTD